MTDKGPAGSLSRRRLLSLLGAGGAGLLGRTIARAGVDRSVRVGAVLPLSSGGTPRRADTPRLAGDAAYRGAVFAEERWQGVELLVSNAPDTDTVLRSAERLVGLEEVAALVGGFGLGQAESLRRVAEERGVLFLNIGSPQHELRERGCGGHTFHVEPSAAMYLDALAGGIVEDGSGRWLLVHADDEQGSELARRAALALVRQGSAGEVSELALAGPGDYPAVIDAVRRDEPDVVLPLLDWRPQLDLSGYYEAAGARAGLTGFPFPVTQTRAFLASLARAAPRSSAGKRVASWEATLVADGAERLNSDFFARWGIPMDPSSWAAYASLKILLESVAATGTAEGDALARHLESGEARFDLAKGGELSFDPADHQLRQPLYLIEVEPGAPDLMGLAAAVARVPARPGDSDLPPGEESAGAHSTVRCR